MFGYGKNPRTALERDQQYQIERLEREGGKGGWVGGQRDYWGPDRRGYAMRQPL